LAHLVKVSLLEVFPIPIKGSQLWPIKFNLFWHFKVLGILGLIRFEGF